MRFRRLAVLGVIALVAAILPITVASGAPGSAILYAGQDVPVGTVDVTNNATDLTVALTLDPGWCMTESHLSVATSLADIPQTKNGNPIPGQFPLGGSYPACDGSDTFVIPFADLGASSGDTVFVAVHLRVWELASETAMWVCSDDGNTTVTSTSALPLGQLSTPFPAVDVWEAFGDPVDPTPSVWDAGVGTSTFSCADWIWQSYRVVTPGVDETVTFERSFDVPGAVAPGSWMLVTSDDEYTASLNGTTVASDVWPNWPSVESASPFSPVAGANTLVFIANNSDDSYGSAGTIDTNPGGLIYEARVNYYSRGESAWAGTAVGETGFPGKNWATYFTYEVQPLCPDITDIADISFVSAPTSVVPEALTNDAKVSVFLESGPAQFATLPIDIPGDGSLAKWVCSYYLHADQVGTSYARYTGDLTFESDVVGLIVGGGAFDTNTSLNDTDGTLGASGTTYPDGATAWNGLELVHPTPSAADTASTSGGTVNFDLKISGATDDIRIVVEAVP